MDKDDVRAKPKQRTVIGVFHTMEQAQRAFDELRREAFSRDEISFIASKAGTSDWAERTAQPGSEARGDDIAADAGIGAAVGGVGGLLLSFAGLAVPGVGPVIAAGPILAALGGAGIGAAAGGLIGALTESGVPADEAGYYAEGVRRGAIVITVTAPEALADKAAAILERSGALDIDDRVSGWRNRGWTHHDSTAEPLTVDEIRREREYWSAAERQGDEWEAQTQSTAHVESERPRRESRRRVRIYPS